jgi:hypothetical protein
VSPSVFPNMPIIVGDDATNRKMGSVARSKDGKLFGVTFAGFRHQLAKKSVYDQHQNKIGDIIPPSYLKVDQLEDVSQFLSLIDLKRNISDIKTVRHENTWPRLTAEPAKCLGKEAFESMQSETKKPLGRVVNTHGNIKIPNTPAESPQIVATSAIILEVNTKSAGSPGLSGASFLNGWAELIGLAVARQKYGDRECLVLAPIGRLLADNNLSLFSPPATHWTDLRYRAEQFSSLVEQSPRLDLGPPPLVKVNAW